MKIRTCLVIALLAAAPAVAQNISLTPIPQDAADLNISGTWSYQSAEHANSGPCPAVPPKSGELSIVAETGHPARVDVISGELCGKPMRLLAGDIEWGNLVVGNAKTVDDEGGQVFNSMVAYFFSDKHGSGHLKSLYTHPDGLSCTWSYRVELTR